MNQQKVLDDNYNVVDRSFLHYLNERCQFNIESFWEFYDCIVELGKNNCKQGFSLELLRKLNFVYKNILELFLYHMDSNDGYDIKEFPEEKYTFYLERLDEAVDAFFAGYEIKDETFELKRLK